MNTESSKDQALQLVRRIDWRYLLPDSRLRNVAYFGLRDEPLMHALEQYCDSFSVHVHEGQHLHSDKHKTYDLVVVNSPQLIEVRKAVSTMKPGASLYWEVNRLSTLKYVHDEIMGSNISTRAKLESVGIILARLVRPNSYVAFAKTLGLKEVSIFWHRPDFNRCLEIVPLDNRRVLDYCFSRSQGAGLKNIKYRAGKLLLESGILKSVVPCFSLVAMR